MNVVRVPRILASISYMGRHYHVPDFCEFKNDHEMKNAFYSADRAEYRRNNPPIDTRALAK